MTFSAALWQARFVGTGLTLTWRCGSAPLDQNSCRGSFALTVDGVPQADVAAPSSGARDVELLRNLLPGVHDITLRRRHEAQLGPVLVCAARAHGGHMLPPPGPKKRALLIIGDSISAGYGNLCSGAKGQDPLLFADGTQTYGALAAAAVDADVRIMAWSGRGLWRNGDGSSTGTLPQIWAATRQPNEVPQHLDAVVVNLGTNDLRNKTFEPVAFVDRYAAFVRQLIRAYPTAHIFLAVGPMLIKERDLKAGMATHNTEACALSLVRQTAAALRKELLLQGRLHLITFAPQDGSLGFGCDYHPSVMTQTQMARVLQQALGQALGW